MLDKIHNLPTIIDIPLIPDFSLMAFSSAIEPLRLANRLADGKLYIGGWLALMETPLFPAMVWRLFRLAAEYNPKPKLIFVISGYGVQFYNNDKLFSFLRKSAREGVVLGAFSTGAYVLAKAGL